LPLCACHGKTLGASIGGLTGLAAIEDGGSSVGVMALDQLRQFLLRVQENPVLRQAVQAAATADDVAVLASRMGFEFSGDELLRISGQKVGRVTVTKQDIPGEYN
jgi:predicted ribosomally synthesized peptide with nif11-like leader